MDQTWIDSQYLAGQTTSGIVADGSNPIVSNCVNATYTTFANGTPTGFDVTSNGSATHNAGTADEIPIVNGNIYHVVFDLTLNSGTLPQLLLRETLQSVTSSNIVNAIEGKNSHLLTCTNTATGVISYFNTSTTTNYEITNLSIIDITNQQVSTLTENLAFDMPMTVPNTKSGDVTSDLPTLFSTDSWSNANATINSDTDYILDAENGQIYKSTFFGKTGNWKLKIDGTISAGLLKLRASSGASFNGSDGEEYLDLTQSDLPAIVDISVYNATANIVLQGSTNGATITVTQFEFFEVDATTLDLSSSANHGTVSGATATYDGLVNAGAGIAYIPSEVAEGVWEFNFNKVSDVSEFLIQFIANSISGTETYGIRIRSAEKIQLLHTGTSGLLFQTIDSYITINTDYRVKITRTSTGIFTVYIKGGAFGWDDWTTVVADSGTNPVTNNTYTSSTYLFVDIDPTDTISDLHINGKPISLSDAIQSTGTWTTTKPSYYYDGGDEIEIATAFNSILAGDWTISLWIQPDDGHPTAFTKIFGNSIDVDDNIYLALLDDGTLRFRFEANADNFYIDSDSAIFPDGSTEWTHITLTGNQATSTLKMYINGILESTTTIGSISAADWAQYLSTSDLFYYGSDGGLNHFVGHKAHPRIWNEVRSTTEITQDYNKYKHIYQ